MKVAILGTGLMGTGFAEGLLNAGHEVIVYNRTKARTEGLVALGATAVDTPAEAFEKADASILVMLDGAAVRGTLLEEVTKSSLYGKKILNASTTQIDEIVSLTADVKALGCNLAEATILTGPEELRTKQSSFYLGCEEGDKEFWTEVLGSVSPAVLYVGETGKATMAETPMVFSSAFGLITAAYTASVVRKLNLPQEIVDTYAGILGPMGDYMLPIMIRGDYDQVMASVDNNVTVAKTAESSAKVLGFPSEVFAAIASLLEETANRGYGQKDGSAVCEVILNPIE